ncbi:MAG: S8 family serine peptidase, partial [Candidatus Rokuibacteriota bacterium]
ERTLPVFIERRSGLRLVGTEEVVVRFEPSASAARRRKLLDGLGLAVTKTSEFDPRAHVVVPTALRRAARALDLANLLAEADDVVTYAAPNFLAEFGKESVNDPRFGQQWHLRNTGRQGGTLHEDVRAPGAWALVGGGRAGIVIAIVDDGVSITHPDLEANIWRNPDRSAKDRHGRDFVNDKDRWNPNPKVFKAPYDSTELNDIHGTPCAGVAAAVGNNRKGVAGVAYRCTILPVKVFAANLAPIDRLADGIRYATRHADVLSCSWTSAPHPDIESAVRDATTLGRRGRGAPLFAATGNDDTARIGFPAGDPNAFGVGASNDRGRRSRYSNHGKGIAFVAPSSDEDAGRQGITTTDVHLRSRGYSSGYYCDDFGGTSSATPLAAGVAALVLSANPALSWSRVGDILKTTADEIGGAQAGYRRGYSTLYGHGRVNAEAAVQQALSERRRRRSSTGRRG